MYFNMDKTVNAVMFGKMTQTCGYWHNGRRINNHMLLYFVSGRLSMQVGNDVYCVCPGELLLIPQNTFYKPLDTNGCTYYFFHFTADSALPDTILPVTIRNETLPENCYAYLYSVNKKPVIKIDIHTHRTNHSDIDNIFLRISGINVSKNSSRKILLDNLLRELLILVSIDFVQTTKSNNTLEKILVYIHANFSRDLTLSSISHEFFISKSYISRLFRNFLNTTLSHYINRIRLGNACELLLNSNMPISEVAEKSGYSDQYYFSKVFRKFFSISPSAFRKSNTVI